MDCTSCYEVELAQCPDEIIVKAGLPANTDVYWLLKDSLGNFFQRKVTTDTDGTLTIDTDELPNGLLMPHRSWFELTLRDGNEYLQTVSFIFNDSPYTCVLIKFINVDYDKQDGSNLNTIEYITPIP